MHSYTCPTCGKTTEVAERAEAPFRPFCCERCKLIDLGRWLNEEYRISEPCSEDDLADEESGEIS